MESVRIKKVLRVINVPKIICDHTLGKNHSPKHRKQTGMILFAAAFLIPNPFETHMLQHIAEYMITSLHAIGLTPLIENYGCTGEKCEMPDPK